MRPVASSVRAALEANRTKLLQDNGTALLVAPEPYVLSPAVQDALSTIGREVLVPQLTAFLLGDSTGSPTSLTPPSVVALETAWATAHVARAVAAVCADSATPADAASAAAAVCGLLVASIPDELTSTLPSSSPTRLDQPGAPLTPAAIADSTRAGSFVLWAARPSLPPWLQPCAWPHDL